MTPHHDLIESTMAAIFAPGARVEASLPLAMRRMAGTHPVTAVYWGCELANITALRPVPDPRIRIAEHAAARLLPELVDRLFEISPAAGVAAVEMMGPHARSPASQPAYDAIHQTRDAILDDWAKIRLRDGIRPPLPFGLPTAEGVAKVVERLVGADSHTAEARAIEAWQATYEACPSRYKTTVRGYAPDELLTRTDMALSTLVLLEFTERGGRPAHRHVMRVHDLQAVTEAPRNLYADTMAQFQALVSTPRKPGASRPDPT